MIMEYKIHQALSCFFCCLLCVAGEFIRLQELEGNTVTIHTGIIGVQSDAQILWFYGPENINSNIVDSRMNNGTAETDYYRDRFSGRLQLNRTSGSLTIRNISREDSGVYILEILTKRREFYNFSVNVSEENSNGEWSSNGTTQPVNAEELLRLRTAVLIPAGLTVALLILLVCFCKKPGAVNGDKTTSQNGKEVH